MWVYQEIRCIGDYTAYYARHTPRQTALVYSGFETDYATLDGETTREVEPQAFTVSYRNKVRLPWAGSAGGAPGG